MAKRSAGVTSGSSKGEVIKKSWRVKWEEREGKVWFVEKVWRDRKRVEGQDDRIANEIRRIKKGLALGRNEECDWALEK